MAFSVLQQILALRQARAAAETRGSQVLAASASAAPPIGLGNGAGASVQELAAAAVAAAAGRVAELLLK